MTRERIALWLVIALALGLRVAFVLGQRSEVFFDTPQLDEAHYVEYAHHLVDGTPDDQDHLPYWQPPGISYLLYATFSIAGPGLLWPRLLSALASAASCLVLFAIARRLFSVRVALAAAAVLAVHGPVIFQSAELLPATLAMLLGLVTVWLVLIAADRAADRISGAIAGGAGVALGASALFAATLLPFALVGVIALRKRRAALLAFLVGIALPIAPVTARNWIRSGELVLISSNGGLNFYIGNNADYKETFSLRPGRHWEELVGEPEVVVGAKSATAAASSYFMHKGLAFYKADPIGASELLVRKLYLFCNGAEIARDSDIYAVRGSSWLLRILVWPDPLHAPDGILIPLALVGIVLLWPQRRRLAVPLAFLGIQAIFISLFFVSARHRVPAMPIFVLFAVAAVPELVRLSTRRRIAAGIAFVALVVALNWPTWETRFSLAGEHELFRGKSLVLRGDLVAADAAMRRATELSPNDERTWFELGNTDNAMGRLDEAAAAWSHAAELDPWDSRARRREAVARSRMGDVDGAVRALEALIATHAREPAHYAPDHLNLAMTYVQRGPADEQRAIEHLRAATADPSYLRGALPKLVGPALGTIRSAAFLHELADIARRVGLPDLAEAADARAAAIPSAE